MKKILLYLILFMAIIMAGTVAYVSVGGLLKVFSGAGTLGLMLFSTIEVGKIIATSAIHTYGKIIGKLYKTLLTIGIVIAMAITSMGIYGFLSSTYKDSFSKMNVINSKLELISKRTENYKSQLELLISERESVSKNISELSVGLTNNVIEYKDKETGQIIRTTSSATRRALEKQIAESRGRRDAINLKIDEVTGKISDLDNEALEVEMSDDASAELGPLKYLSDISGIPMDSIMKWFILLLIVIGDPMAVLMVIVFNKVVDYVSENNKKEKKEKKIKASNDKIDVIEPKKEDVEEIKKVTTTFLESNEVNLKSNTTTPVAQKVETPKEVKQAEKPQASAIQKVEAPKEVKQVEKPQASAIQKAEAPKEVKQVEKPQASAIQKAEAPKEVKQAEKPVAKSTTPQPTKNIINNKPIQRKLQAAQRRLNNVNVNRLQ